MKKTVKVKTLVIALASAGLASIPGYSLANPTGGQVVAGNATIRQESATKVGITQTTDRAIIDWQKFSIGANEHVQYYQPSASSVTLNRVVGQDPSQILGRLTANGQVFLVNPNGIYFGKNAQIDVAGLVASTHNIRNEDFMAGKYLFNIPGKPGASIINEGQIRIADTGIAAFVAPSVANRGVIAAKLGKVALASANGFTLDFHGDELLTFMVGDEVAKTAFDLEGNQLTSFVENSGKIQASGGYVLLTAKAAENAIHNVINQSGLIEASSVGQQNGDIILSGGQHGVVSNTGTLDASGKAAGQTGGKVQITGETIGLFAGTLIDVSGDQGGGKAIVGGDYLGGSANAAQLAETGMVTENYAIPTARNVTVSSNAKIQADAVNHGNGGKVILWADEQLSFDGFISAKGGLLSGNGGKVETSGKMKLLANGLVDASASRGQSGLWFMDPTRVRIANSGGDVSAQVISQALSSGTSVTVSTANCSSLTCTISSGSGLGSIEVLSDIIKSAGGAATLNLQTYDGAIIVNQGARIYSTSGPLNVNINARYGNANPGYALVAIGNDNNYAIETNGGQVDITGLIQTYQGKAIKTNGGQVLARTTPTANDSDTRGFIGIGPVPVNATSAYTIDAGNGSVNMRATDGTVTLDDHAIKANSVSLRGNVYARPNILSFNMADEAARAAIENGFGGASGYGTNFPGNDDNSIPVNIASLSGNGLTMLGRNFGETIFLSNNGFMRFDVTDGSFTPYPLNNTSNPMVAAYFGDVDTRGAGSVYYATRANSNDNKAILTWVGTGYYSYGTNKTNTFQLQLENLGVETNMRLSYQQLQWTTGSASGGSNGLGGTVARAGIVIPGTNETIRFELPSSGRETEMLALAQLPGNTGKAGVWSFRLWPQVTPPNYRNGRFEVAANSLSVNGSNSGHQLERGSPEASTVENVDRRRAEDYLSQLLVNRFAYQGPQELFLLPSSQLIAIEGEKEKETQLAGGTKQGNIPGSVATDAPGSIAEATNRKDPLVGLSQYLASKGLDATVSSSILTLSSVFYNQSSMESILKFINPKNAEAIKAAFVDTLEKKLSNPLALSSLTKDISKGLLFDTLFGGLADEIKVRGELGVWGSAGVDVLTNAIKNALLSSGSGPGFAVAFQIGFTTDMASFAANQSIKAFKAASDLNGAEKDMNASALSVAIQGITLKESADNAFKLIGANKDKLPSEDQEKLRAKAKETLARSNSSLDELAENYLSYYKEKGEVTLKKTVESAGTNLILLSNPFPLSSKNDVKEVAKSAIEIKNLLDKGATPDLFNLTNGQYKITEVGKIVYHLLNDVPFTAWSNDDKQVQAERFVMLRNFLEPLGKLPLDFYDGVRSSDASSASMIMNNLKNAF